MLLETLETRRLVFSVFLAGLVASLLAVFASRFISPFQTVLLSLAPPLAFMFSIHLFIPFSLRRFLSRRRGCGSWCHRGWCWSWGWGWGRCLSQHTCECEKDCSCGERHHCSDHIDPPMVRSFCLPRGLPRRAKTRLSLGDRSERSLPTLLVTALDESLTACVQQAHSRRILSAHHLKEVASLDFPAHINRAPPLMWQFDVVVRARSASKRDGLAASAPSF
jgi:hypothetical protein